MNIEIQKGKAMVLAGPQGSGKSIKAREIAEKHGKFIEMDLHQFVKSEFLPIDADTKTVIIDGLPKSEKEIAELKAFIANDEIVIKRKHLEPITVKTPNFIFCTCEVNALLLSGDERRYMVCEL
jgi:ABC-type dipeptide/oligopeptide/nickel transport system ATPase component